MPRHAGIADACQHIADRIANAHGVPPHTSGAGNSANRPQRYDVLPARLHNTRNQALQRVLAKTDAAHAKLPHIGTRTAARLTAMVLAHLKLGRARRLYNQ
ncbi:hypothetical protein OSCT_0187 [Oscillochloris trichoides DG-6]|uniref:Uncharacterized protein n=1 Tax=Oscillochloris trichoides DG-6 TaxID=765420 RepID=E1IA36_9CHLR|nr:hypothetical protein OSCT_0187 [Oscillochloris trichoides DG-6]